MAFTVRTDEEMEVALEALTELEGASRQQVIRRAVLDRYEQRVRQTEFHEAAQTMYERWGDVLQRLAKT